MALVPSASAFSLPLPLWQQNPSLRVTKYESRKRKKQYDTGEDTDHNDGGETTDAASEKAPISQSLLLSSEEAHQYRTAGLSFDEELPGGSFPHGAAEERVRQVNTRGAILRQLSSLTPPLYAPQSAAHQGNLRFHHLAVLTAVMHRCLLDGDYIRAGRAWGLIIREQFGGHPIDVRTEDRWGIGAEILLRQDRQKCKTATDTSQSTGRVSKLHFTRKGFEDAREYYEMLIIQHPYQKTAPNVTSALHFYPAMFGLWIYVTQEESIAARNSLDDQRESSIEEPCEDEDPGSELDGHGNSGQRHQALVAGVRAKELEQAQKISARMDEMIVSPPYSDSPELLELRGMVSLWIADLFVSSVPGGKSDDYKRDDDENYDNEDNDLFMSSEEFPSSVFERRERRLAMERREAEIEKSKEFMGKAQQRKLGVASRLQDLHIDDLSLGRLNMGVGDYVHSKEARQHDPQPTKAVPNQSRQALADQARVEVPTAALIAPVPIQPHRQAPLDRYGSPFHEQLNVPAEQPVYRDVFDTDVEGIDDSTVAGTSVYGIDDIPYRLSPAITAQPQHIEHPPQPSPSPPHQFRPVRRPHDSKWYEGLGDRAMKSAGFALDDIDSVSQLTSTAGDDEQSNDTDDQRFAPRYRATEEPMSRRLQNFWSASRRSYSNHDSFMPSEPSKNPSFIPVASTSKPLPTSARKVTLTRSMTTTPRTRFSPPKPSLLDQLDLTPTRHSSGSRSQPSKDAEKSDTDLQDPDEGLGLFADDHARSSSFQSLNVFDMTNLDDLDDDPINDPFARRNSVVRRTAPEPTETTKTRTKKRQLDMDYPPEILYKKSFADLQAEPFDQTPPSQSASETQSTPEKGKEEGKISFLIRLSDQERHDYFAKLSMDEWEDHGDLLVEEFSKMMLKMKDLRHARRKTAALFEGEIKRRHNVVEELSTELSTKFEEMRAGGAEMLRGRTP
ncbi:hypothetical protein P175DRAFT_0441511 [Aspergillus ochraceoroseus IBT 24754]|uniref:Extracellular mutant protein 11 C-terminal domain-containing protein n=1 Tax=Aspergillus ochraceoroseus IBT 24754 TaxID=1392256 RepID=A0A2T5LSS7_9EURO|nr:uncharacterized protein P175DRAFT_0441511 [Aspergillus ochraceoroseus IBT 24754]PTU19342.1 hypothetical protein P175DRAFT_0441511 [Aspergillus ochraceoroseus IBT 24754]